MIMGEPTPGHSVDGTMFPGLGSTEKDAPLCNRTGNCARRCRMLGREPEGHATGERLPQESSRTCEEESASRIPANSRGAAALQERTAYPARCSNHVARWRSITTMQSLTLVIYVVHFGCASACTEPKFKGGGTPPDPRLASSSVILGAMNRKVNVVMSSLHHQNRHQPNSKADNSVIPCFALSSCALWQWRDRGERVRGRGRPPKMFPKIHLDQRCIRLFKHTLAPTLKNQS
jgi:hypothetical protein